MYKYKYKLIFLFLFGKPGHAAECMANTENTKNTYGILFRQSDCCMCVCVCLPESMNHTHSHGCSVSFLYRSPVGSIYWLLVVGLCGTQAEEADACSCHCRCRCATYSIVKYIMWPKTHNRHNTKYMHAKSVEAFYVNMAKIDARRGDNETKEPEMG